METECGTVTDYQEHNRVLEQSPDFQKILPEVEKEVYTQFTLDSIREMELYLANGGWRSTQTILNVPHACLYSLVAVIGYGQ